MTDCKKLIMGFGYRNGKAFSWNGKLEYEGRLKDLARTACDNGADEIFICDRSFSDEDHEAVIGAIKETARTVDEPILAGGRIRRLPRSGPAARRAGAGRRPWPATAR